MAVLNNLVLDFVTDRKDRSFKFEECYGKPCEIVLFYFGDSMRIKFEDRIIETSWVVKPIARKGNYIIITTLNSIYCFKIVANKKLGLENQQTKS